jgi:hypothetical protein
MRKRSTVWTTACAAAIVATSTHAASLGLFQPVEIAAGTYLLASTIPGEAHVGVIVGARSVAIIGAPKSGVYARQIVQHVAELTDKPISHVIVLSQFCDHACGSAELGEIATVVASDRLDPKRAPRWVSTLDEGPEYHAGAGIAAPQIAVASSVSIDLGGRTVVVIRVDSAFDVGALVAYQPDIMIAWAGPLFRGDDSIPDASAQRAVREALPRYRIIPGSGG